MAIDDQDYRPTSRRYHFLYFVLPTIMAVYGIYCIVQQHAVIRRRQMAVEFFGWGAVAFGMFWISFGAVVYHIHYWQHSEDDLPPVVRWTASVSGLTLVGSIIAIVVYYFRDFR